MTETDGAGGDGRELWAGGHLGRGEGQGERFDDLDEICARHVEPLVENVGEICGHRKFSNQSLELADKQRELEKASFLDRINARPSKPFQQQDFERLWQSSGQEMRDELLDALLKMLDEWGLARPCETAWRPRVRGVEGARDGRALEGAGDRWRWQESRDIAGGRTCISASCSGRKGNSLKLKRWEFT